MIRSMPRESSVLMFAKALQIGSIAGLVAVSLVQIRGFHLRHSQELVPLGFALFGVGMCSSLVVGNISSPRRGFAGLAIILALFLAYLTMPT